MKYCILDTETTGLPITVKFGEYHSPDKLEYYNNSRVLQLAWKIVEINENKVESTQDFNYYINYDDEISNSHIHNITLDYLKEHGNPLEQVLDIFLNSIEHVDQLVGHNVNFDIYVLQSEICRLKKNANLFDKKSYCTMKHSVNVTKIMGKHNTFKFPRLSELYSHFFEDLSLLQNAHNAKTDVELCFRCFLKLLNIQH